MAVPALRGQPLGRSLCWIMSSFLLQSCRRSSSPIPADASGAVAVCQKCRPTQLQPLFAIMLLCIVATEICASVYYSGFSATRQGIVAAYVEAFVKWWKNHRADREAVCEGARWPSERFATRSVMRRKPLDSVAHARSANPTWYPDE